MKTTQEEYLAKLQKIQDTTSTTLTMVPSTEPRFIIDSDTREITIPEDFTFLGVLNDTRAETYYFEIDRYFDDVDLSTHTCIVQFAAVNGSSSLAEDISPVTKLDVETVSGKILFGWTITNAATQYASNVKFSIRFYTVDSSSGSTVFTYCFNTLTGTLPVLDTLDVTDEVSEKYASLFDEWETKMQTLYTNVSETYNTMKAETEAALEEARGYANAASESEQNAATSETNANAAKVASQEALTSITEIKVEVATMKAETEAALEEARGYANAASYSFGPDANGVFSFYLNVDDTTTTT